MDAVIGIDLGTTNSCVAFVDEQGSAHVISNKSGHSTTPSIVAVTEGEKRLVGQLAKRQAVINAEHTVFASKRLIGRRFDDEATKRAMETLPYSVVDGPHGDARIKIRENVYAIPEISSMILQELRMVAEQKLNQSVSKAVVTVPAYFNDNQRQATKDAGKIAGLEVLRIINEPTAAALAYGFGKEITKKIAVYDMGGGTFDISILEIGQGVFEVLSSAGDTFLGGEDFDERIIEWLVFSFAKEHKVDLRKDKMALQRLKEAAENAKVELSSVSETEINLPFIYTQPDGPTLHLQKTLTKEKLEELGADLIERSIHICAGTLESAGVSRQTIDDVVLVGGMTRMPKIQEAVKSFFGRPPSRNVHPDEVVALGAAIQGNLLVTGNRDTLLLDVTPHNLGIMVAGGGFDVIIPKDTTIPTNAQKTFTTVKDNQTQVRIIVLQGEYDKADKNELLGEFVLSGLPEANKGDVSIEVEFSISADGIVSVLAKDLSTGREQNIVVTASSGLTEDEIFKMAEENQDYLVTVEDQQKFHEIAGEAQQILKEINKLKPDVEKHLSSAAFGDDVAKKAVSSIRRVEDAIQAKDYKAVQAGLDPLKRTLELFRRLTNPTS